MKILALDASTKSTGYAFYDDEGKLQYGVIVSKDSEVKSRITQMREGVIKLIKENNIEAVIIEEVRPDGMNADVGKKLTWLQGVLAIGIYEYDSSIKLHIIGPSSWRSRLGIQGYRIKRDQQKQIDIEYVNKRCGLSLGPSEDDAADAIGILLSGIPEPVVAKPKKGWELGTDKSAF